MADFSTIGRVTALVGNVATIPEAALQPGGWYLGGVLQCEDGSMRMITGHVGAQITITRAIAYLTTAFGSSGYGRNYGNLYGGVAVQIHPGCDRTMSTCDSKFDNLDNNGSFAWIPSKNPFGGSSIA